MEEHGPLADWHVWGDVAQELAVPERTVADSLTVARILNISFISLMKRVALLAGLSLLVLLGAVLAYGLDGYFSARADANSLRKRADWLISHQRGPKDLGPGRVDQLLLVEDPGFWTHDGTDWSTPGSGLTTLTQSLGKRLGFAQFHPGLGKLRLIGYAKGLASGLSKPQILALYLDTVWLGRGPNGRPIIGMFNASDTVFHRPVSKLSDHQFLSLIAVLIAPRKLDLLSPNADLSERVARIERLISNKCRPRGYRDVWLEGCAKR